MTHDDRINLGLLVLALGASLGLALWFAARDAAHAAPTSLRTTSADIAENGSPAFTVPASPKLVDASGALVEAKAFSRIASANPVVDELLLELCEPERVVAYSARSASNPRLGYRLGNKATIALASDAERLLALRPDLVIVMSNGNFAWLTTLREANLTVFDLGELRGLLQLRRAVSWIAQLIGHPERGERMLDSLQTRVRQLETSAAKPPQPAVYVALYGDKMFGGTRDTSYEDLLRLGGLRDVARQRYTGWPQYTSEQLLLLNPRVIVTHRGMGRGLCAVSGLQELEPCRDARGFVELDEHLATDPGLGLLEAAQEIQQQLSGAARAASE